MNVTTSFRIAIQSALQDPSALPATIARTKHMYKIVKAGENRKADSEKKYDAPVPRFCIFSVTWRCNLDCKGCYAKSYEHKEDMPLPQIEQVIREAADLGTYLWVIAGGEPLLVEGLIETLASINNAFFFLFSNGTLLSDEHVQAFKKAKNILPIISVEGETHCTDFRRGEHVGELVEEAMKKLKKTHIPFGFSAMLTHENLDTVTSRVWFDRMWATGVRFGFFIDYIPFAKDLNPDYILTGEDRRTKNERLEQRNKEAKPIVFNLPADEYKQAGGHCMSAGKGFMHINADGFVEPCPFTHYAADNVQDKSILEILSSDFFSRIRKEFKDLPNPRGECMLFSHPEELKAIVEQTGARSTESNKQVKS